MKTSIKIAVAALVIASFGFEGCKKGANDPFLSFSSRKSRMAGEWKVSAGSGTDVQGSSTSTWTYDGAVWKTTSGSTTTSTNRTITMNFEKDGTYKTVTTTTGTGYSNVITETGTWNFTGKVGEDKNKDHVVMRTLSSVDVTTIGSSTSTSTDTFTGDSAPSNIMYIDQLKGKEIIMTYDGTYSNGTASSNQTNTGSYTLTPQ
jgi:hypothetical protein